MKEEIKTEDIQKFNRDGAIFTVLLMVTLVLIVPLFLYLEMIGVVIWLVLFGVTMYYAFRVEKQKKIHDIQTYREIIAFSDGKKLDEIEKIRESGKRPYQTVLSLFACVVIALVVTVVCLFLFM